MEPFRGITQSTPPGIKLKLDTWAKNIYIYQRL